MNTKRILCVNLKVPGMVAAPPLGLGYIAAPLAQAGYSLFLIDGIIENAAPPKVLERIKQEDIGIVCINVTTPSFGEVRKLVEALKNEMPSIVIIVGGPHATLLPLETFNALKNLDYLVLGEGEKILLKILNAINYKESLENESGLIYRSQGMIQKKEGINYLEDLNEFPEPYRTMMDISKYSAIMASELKPVTSIMTSRGCPFSCIFCSKPVTGSRLRYRSIPSVIDEIRHLVDTYHIKELIFYDDIFTMNKERVLELCRAMLRHKLDIQWKCETRVNLVDEELLRKMKEAGCYMIAYGIESGSKKVLDILKKNVTIAQITNAVELTQKAGIKTFGYFMLGIPGETEDDIKATIRLAKQLKLSYCQFSIATAFPGTELHRMAKRSGKCVDDFSRLLYVPDKLEGIVSLSDVDAEVLKRYIRKAYVSFYLSPAYIMAFIRSITIHNVGHVFAKLKMFLKLFT